MSPRPANFFVFLVERGFLHVGQSGLKLLTSGDLPPSASQSAEITGMRHCAQPCSTIHVYLSGRLPPCLANFKCLYINPVFG